MSRLELIATTAFGLEAVVARELADLGYTQQQVEDGRVTFVGSELAICRANLWLRAAERVLIKVGQFPARDFGQLFDATAALPWDQWLPVDARFPVTGRSVRSQLHSVPTVQSVVKKAIVENLKRKYGRHWFQETGPDYPIDVSVQRDIVTLTIDTSGLGLHKRGYRRLGGRAPLRETTAAALVLLSYWKSDRPFWDPFCGSGTLPIEAALIGRNRAPGLNRNFVCESWSQITRNHWRMAREEARDLQRRKPPVPWIGSDIDPRAIKWASENATAAGVLGDIEFRQLDVLEMKSSHEYGVVICNPPYGERLGDSAAAEAIYDDMADAFAPLKTWSFYVLTAHPEFERHFRRRADRRRKLYNGRIECTYYQFFGPPPPSSPEAQADWSSSSVLPSPP